MNLFRITESEYPKWIKYNLHKNNTPCWQGVKNKIDEEKYLKELRADGYNPFIDKKAKQQTQTIIKGRMKNNIFKIQQINSTTKTVLTEMLEFQKKNKLNTLRVFKNNYYIHYISLNNLIENLKKRNVDVKQIFEL
jgi:hypothetical protein